MAATVLFGLQFFFNKLYQKGEGCGLSAAMMFTFLNSVACAVVMFCLNKFHFEFSLFSLAVAFICAINNLLYSYSAVNALGKADLSTFSIFAMLGGMVLPFIGGIVFWNEKFTPVKLICCILIALALFIGSPRGKSDRSAIKYYAAVFIFNGMSGIISKIHQSGAEHVSSEGYMILSSASAALLSGIMLCIIFVVRGQKPSLKRPLPSISGAAAYGLISGLGNLFLLIALGHIETSVQYPLVTGGTIVVSAIISLFSKEKPTPRSLIAVGISFAATLVLIF